LKQITLTTKEGFSKVLCTVADHGVVEWAKGFEAGRKSCVSITDYPISVQEAFSNGIKLGVELSDFKLQGFQAGFENPVGKLSVEPILEGSE